MPDSHEVTHLLHAVRSGKVVHEAYLRVFGSASVEWQDRAHFFAVAARQMRRVLVDHARKKNRELKFFSGMKDEEAAQALRVSLATVRRDWTFARAWLFDQVRSAG